MCEKKGRKINWTIFVEWMVHDQLRRLQCLEATQVAGSGKLLHLADGFVEPIDGEKENEPKHSDVDDLKEYKMPQLHD